MNELMQKIAEKLNVSADKVPEVYRSLKWQYAFWEISGYISWVLFAIIIMVLISYIVVYKEAQNIQTEEELLKFTGRSLQGKLHLHFILSQKLKKQEELWHLLTQSMLWIQFMQKLLE